MSKKGENKKVKTLNAPKSMKINRKKTEWSVRTKAGTHKKEDSAPIGMILRDEIGIAKNLREAKIILKNGEVKINGKVRKKHNFPVGLFDVISLEKQKEYYRVVFDKKRRIRVKKFEKELKDKINKIEFKKKKGKKIQLTTNEGIVIMHDIGNVGDSIKVSIPEGKITKLLEMKVGSIVYIKKGVHCSETGTIKEIAKGNIRREKLVMIDQGKEKFETTAKNIVVIGEKEKEIEL